MQIYSRVENLKLYLYEGNSFTSFLFHVTDDNIFPNPFRSKKKTVELLSSLWTAPKRLTALLILLTEKDVPIDFVKAIK